MSATIVHAIIVEDNEDDALLMIREVQQQGYEMQWQRVQTASEFRAALAGGSVDVVLADYTLPHFSAPDALAIVRESGVDIPFLVVSGTIGEDVAVALVKSGANDFVMKTDMRRLGEAVKRELREAADRRRRSEAERALHDSEERYRTLFESMSVGVIYQNPDGTITSANPAAQRILGLTVDQMQQRTLLDPRWTMIHEDGSPFSDRDHPVAVALRTGQEVHDVIMGIANARDGECHWLRVTAVPQFRPGTPSPWQAYVMLDDITVSRHAAIERETIQVKLLQAQKLESIGELAGGVAHDFNNLLTGILGNAAIMRDALPRDDPAQRNIDQVETAARHATDLTHALLTFARSAVVMPVPVAANDAVEHALMILRQSLPASVDIVCDYDASAWNINIDQVQMTQLIINLGINARNAMHSKGRITVATRNVVIDAPHANQHPPEQAGEYVLFSVSDTGTGIAPEVMPHLFEPFFTTKPPGEGTGLGLSIVYGAVKQAGGWVTVSSVPGAGATFDIYLPRTLEQPKTTSATSVQAEQEQTTGTILVVEDEPIVAGVAQTLLTRQGYTVLVAADGADALDVFAANAQHVDLVLLDMTMPGMTTEETVNAIRHLDRSVPILLDSGFTSGETVASLLENGTIQGFLSKPYDLTQLFNSINRILTSRRENPV